MSKNLLALNATVIAVIFAIATIYFAGITRIVDYVVRIDSEHLATTWTDELQHAIPDLEALIDIGTPTQAQRTQIHNVAHIGDIFRFRLFDTAGKIVVVSDDLSKLLTRDAPKGPNDNAIMVLTSGENIISLNDGTQEVKRPDIYVEAFVPIQDHDGAMLGVIEVFIDQTAIYSLFHRSFSILALVLGAIFILAFGMPYLGFLVKNHQENIARKRAEYLANFDQLTNLLNRHGFMEQLDIHANITKTNPNSIGVIFLDVDHFKNINDSHGHSAGDAFLQHLGAGITKNLQRDDIAGRFGGDEFVIVLQRESSAEVHEFIKNISAAASTPLKYEGSTIIGNISVGVHYEADNDDNADTISFETRMQKADIALYRAKNDGRNTSCMFTDDLEATLIRRKFVEAEILTALEEHRFELYFQPILHQVTLQCTGFEALARIRTADNQIISAVEFVPIADAMGKMGTISTWALHEAITAANQWPVSLTVTVNVASRQLQDITLVSQIKTVLAETGYSPRNLQLEVNESLLLHNTDEVLSQLKQIRKLGVLLAIDNFGTGHSNLSHMWRFEFDTLKIDRTFISEISPKNQRVPEVLDTVIKLAHRLKMEVTAGGVETAEQAQVLSQLSCDHMQGYLYAQPMPAEEIAAYLHDNFIHQHANASARRLRS